MTGNARQETKSSYRKRLFIDMELQGWLLIGLVTLETLLLGGACWYLYLSLNASIDQNLYVIHKASDRQLVTEFTQQMWNVILTCALINTLALIAAHRLWARHVRHILRDFSARLQRLSRLDLSDVVDEGNKHCLLSTYDNWLKLERERLSCVNSLIAKAREDMIKADKTALQDAKTKLEHVRSILKDRLVRYDRPYL